MTAIEWTNHTLNPLVGCSHASAGCTNCYAESASKTGRLQQFSQYHGVVDERGHWTGKINFVPEQLEKLFKFRKPTKVFMPSMSDPFHSAVKDEWLDQIFAAIALNPQVTVQMLTKRPERMLQYLRSAKNRIRIAAVDMGRSKNVNHVEIESCQWDWPLPNLWLGVSVENQAAADERIPLLLRTPAAVRFLSCEPLLERTDVELLGDDGWQTNPDWHPGLPMGTRYGLKGIHWVIVGGESGSGARPFHLEWAESLIQQCNGANVPLFVKQLGSNPSENGQPLKLRDRKGANPQEWPELLRVREFPEAGIR